MKNKKQKFIRFFLIIIAVIIALFIAAFLLRNTILKQIIEKAEIKFSREYNCEFSVKNAKFIGLSEISMSDINLIPTNADTLLSIKSFEAKINIFEILSGNIQLQNLKIKDGFVQLVKNENGKNFGSFFKSKPKNEVSDTLVKKDYADLAYRFITKVLNLIPEKSAIQNFAFKLDDMGKKVMFKTDNLSLENQQLITILQVTTTTFTQNWLINGIVNPRKKIADIIIKNNDTTQIRLPYIDEKLKLPTSFDNLHLKIAKIGLYIVDF